MASFQLLRQFGQLPGKLGKCGQLSVIRTSLATQHTATCLSKSVCQKHTMTPRLMQNSLLKSLPQLSVVRTVATTAPRATSATGDHVRLWQVERIVSAVLIGLMPACLIAENAVVDGALALLIVMHSHWGLEAIVLDYARPAVVGNILPKVAFFALNVFSAATLAGLLYLIYNGGGLGTTVKRFWTALDGKKPAVK